MVNVNERTNTRMISTLQDKFIFEIGGIYDAEYRFLEAQQMMVRHARNGQLKAMLEMHIDQTEQQIKNLKQVFRLLNLAPIRITCETAAGLARDGQKLIEQTATNPSILNLGLAGIQSKVEHFEIACYRGLVAVAQQLGENEIVNLLTENLQQEERTSELVKQNLPLLLQAAMSARNGDR